MRYSPSKRAADQRLKARKQPSQPRSALTVDAILEAAAHILEDHGLAAYSTNAVAARAGVSIGSLYQYFPNKDAVTSALIDREASSLAIEVRAGLASPEWRTALSAMIDAAVRHQLRRPRLARVLDFEEHRLSRILGPSPIAAAVRGDLTALLDRRLDPQLSFPEAAAAGVMAITGALTDALGDYPQMDPKTLSRWIEAAILGYLSATGAPPAAEAQSAPDDA